MCYYSLHLEHSRNNLHHKVLDAFSKIHQSDGFIYGSGLTCVLKACDWAFNHFNHSFVKQVHCLCLKTRYEADVSAGNSLVDIYFKTNNIEEGEKVFDELVERNRYSWMLLIDGCMQDGLTRQALELFVKMQMERVTPNPFTFVSVLAALAENMVEMGMQAHTQVIKLGFEEMTVVGNSLVSMYFKSGLVNDATRVFESMENKDANSWNGMIAGFVENGYEADVSVGNSLVYIYFKTNNIEEGEKVFDEMVERNRYSWMLLIDGCMQDGLTRQALELFVEMQMERVTPNPFTFVIVLAALAENMVEMGMQAHTQVIKLGFEEMTVVGNSLVSMYFKSGLVNEATRDFDSMENKDVDSWNGMIAGFVENGPQERNYLPDGLTYEVSGRVRR
ncbi:hypothetical protein IFM89_010096 [Coptis chinensis]|uniref:Pentatricopeptide repeat-containing protein n=1 Tax=Coptis chinensis TaxID=261450 RepID=A0A835HZL6_9MAGN|nr:hypothetical protein IFM89_010096 [Coptis chinensis]